MKNSRILVYFLSFFVFLLSPLRAEPVLPHLFSDHMVIQRETEIRIWGWAEAGEKISASFGIGSGQTTADSNGHWRVILPAFEASGMGSLSAANTQCADRLCDHNMTTVGDPMRPPAGRYAGMITPLDPYRIRGAIWYQGEGNTWRAYQHRTLLPALIAGWRNGWKESDFPFLIVQLTVLNWVIPSGRSCAKPSC